MAGGWVFIIGFFGVVAVIFAIGAVKNSGRARGSGWSGSDGGASFAFWGGDGGGWSGGDGGGSCGGDGGGGGGGGDGGGSC